MIMKTKTIKSFLEGFILKILENEPLYTGDILKRLQEKGFYDLSEGTIYPILLRLENNSLLTSKREYNNLSPNRKFYYITLKGKEELNNIMKVWKKCRVICDNILGGE